MSNHVKAWAAKLWHSKLVRSTMVLSAGAAGAQAIAILCAPITTRLYGPEAYGIFGTFSSTLMVFASLGAMSYPLAIVLPKEHREAVQITRLSISAALAIATILTILTFLPTSALKYLHDTSNLGEWANWLPLALLIGIWGQISSQWLTRHKDFKSIATITLANAAWTNIARILAGLIWPVTGALVFIYIAGQAMLAMRMTRTILKRTGEHSGNDPHSDQELTRIRDVALKYRDFPIYRAPQDFINAVSRGAPIIMLSAMSGATVAGFYTLATQLMSSPAGLLGNAAASVLYPDMARKAHDGEDIAPIIAKSTGTLALLGLIPYGGLCLFAPSLFSIAFGEAWHEAGKYCQWLTLFYYFNLINRPAVAAIPILGKQRGLLAYEIFSTSAKLGSLHVGFNWLNSALAAIAIFSIAGAATYAALIAWIFWASHKRDGNGQTS